MTNRIFAERLEYAVGKVCEEIKKKKKLTDWQAMSEEQLWNELVSCILGSQVQHENLQCIINYLISKELLSVKHLLSNSERYERNIQLALKKPIPSPLTKTGKIKYRYPKTKANYIRRTGESIYSTSSSIKGILASCKDEYIASVMSSLKWRIEYDILFHNHSWRNEYEKVCRHFNKRGKRIFKQNRFQGYP